MMKPLLGFAAIVLTVLAVGCSKKEEAKPEAPADNGMVWSCDRDDNATTAKKGRFQRVGEETGRVLKEGAHKAGELAEQGAVETGKALDKASEKTGDALIKTGQWLKDDNTTK
jgi:hypothetical protein